MRTHCTVQCTVYSVNTHGVMLYSVHGPGAALVPLTQSALVTVDTADTAGSREAAVKVSR